MAVLEIDRLEKSALLTNFGNQLRHDSLVLGEGPNSLHENCEGVLLSLILFELNFTPCVASESHKWQKSRFDRQLRPYEPRSLANHHSISYLVWAQIYRSLLGLSVADHFHFDSSQTRAENHSRQDSYPHLTSLVNFYG